MKVMASHSDSNLSGTHIEMRYDAMGDGQAMTVLVEWSSVH